MIGTSTHTHQNRIVILSCQRYEHMDGDLGIVIEPESLPEDLHPFSLVDDQEEGVKGSCMEYKTRCNKQGCLFVQKT